MRPQGTGLLPPGSAGLRQQQIVAQVVAQLPQPVRIRLGHPGALLEHPPQAAVLLPLTAQRRLGPEQPPQQVKHHSRRQKGGHTIHKPHVCDHALTYVQSMNWPLILFTLAVLMGTSVSSSMRKPLPSIPSTWLRFTR